ncbi:hypothetical protein JJD41_12775 [Oxynema sp. CENA135]|uniref:hypothetical protein n=1 Tax=Oxynema sp. CENA135 TaxID=984206 RepID=UPI00190D89F0|nr:hypothetical protein [Oxynema sp. CENA135]MBK4730730.1 hypothetical protein [Oxynema sp. CENA135]
MQDDSILLLDRAVNSVLAHSPDKPKPETVVEALLNAERLAKTSKRRYHFEEFLGTWRLCFVTGTQKTRQRAGNLIGSGLYLPPWVEIELSYLSLAQSVDLDGCEAIGRVRNQVNLGMLQVTLSGPTKFIPPKNIVAFDFTQMQVKLFGAKLYGGDIRGGQSGEAGFYRDRIAKQAFFAYFLVTDTAIAARGRGGGLALWGKTKT